MSLIKDIMLPSPMLLYGLLFTAPFPTSQKLLTINRRATNLEDNLHP